MFPKYFLRHYLIIPIFKVTFVLCLSASAWAWSHVIHRAVAEDVQKQLTPEAWMRIQSHLGPLPLSYWADWADRSSQYPSGWHYVAIDALKESCDPSVNNLYCALTHLIAHTSVVKTEGDRIRLLLHLVVDAHQPLHVDMQGFANIRCRVRVPKKVKLHAWMDRDALGTRGDVGEIASWLAAIRSKKIEGSQDLNPKHWLLENERYWSDIYPPFKGTVPYYCHKKVSHLPVIEEAQQAVISKLMLTRLALASMRLAHLLNHLYGGAL